MLRDACPWLKSSYSNFRTLDRRPKHTGTLRIVNPCNVCNNATYRRPETVHFRIRILKRQPQQRQVQQRQVQRRQLQQRQRTGGHCSAEGRDGADLREHRLRGSAELHRKYGKIMIYVNTVIIVISK